MSSIVLLSILVLLCAGALSQEAIAHSRRDWTERKVWGSVYRQATGGDGDSNNQGRWNGWNTQGSSQGDRGWNRDDASNAGGDGTASSGSSGWNVNNGGSGWTGSSGNSGWNGNSGGSGWNGGNDWNDQGGSIAQTSRVSQSSFRNSFSNAQTVKIQENDQLL